MRGVRERRVLWFDRCVALVARMWKYSGCRRRCSEVGQLESVTVRVDDVQEIAIAGSRDERLDLLRASLTDLQHPLASTDIRAPVLDWSLIE